MMGEARRRRAAAEIAGVCELLSDVGFIGIQIGEKGGLTDQDLLEAAGRTAGMLQCAQPTTPAMVSIDGYDDDPRELWEMSETRDYVLDFFALMMEQNIPPTRFHPLSLGLLMACVNVTLGRPAKAIADLVRGQEDH
jgi:hypothetical protein